MFHKKLKNEIELQRQEIIGLKYKIERLKFLEEDNNKLLKINEDLVARANKAEKKIREQTEADVYFECAKIMKKIENGEKKENLKGQLAYRGDLHARLQAQMVQRPAVPFGSRLGSVFGGIIR